jgi:hypothetical protein
VVIVVGIGLFLIGRHGSADEPNAKPAANPTVPAASYPPVDASPVPRTAVADKLCPGFLAALPDKLGGQDRRRVNAQRAYFLAWGSPPVIVQCGVPRPKGFTVGTATVDIYPPKQTSGRVRWFETGSTGLWTAVDRDVYVAVTVPDGGDTTGTLQDVGTAINKALPARPIDPAAH